MYNRIVEWDVLARAAQQRKQLGAQRQARDKRAGKGEKQRGDDERRNHEKDYKDFISGTQQFSDAGTPRRCHSLQGQSLSGSRFFPARHAHAAMT